MYLPSKYFDAVGDADHTLRIMALGKLSDSISVHSLVKFATSSQVEKCKAGIKD